MTVRGVVIPRDMIISLESDIRNMSIDQIADMIMCRNPIVCREDAIKIAEYSKELASRPKKDGVQNVRNR